LRSGRVWCAPGRVVTGRRFLCLLVPGVVSGTPGGVCARVGALRRRLPQGGVAWRAHGLRELAAVTQALGWCRLVLGGSGDLGG
jgi:hypothetical protein